MSNVPFKFDNHLIYNIWHPYHVSFPNSMSYSMSYLTFDIIIWYMSYASLSYDIWHSLSYAIQLVNIWQKSNTNHIKMTCSIYDNTPVICIIWHYHLMSNMILIISHALVNIKTFLTFISSTFEKQIVWIIVICYQTYYYQSILIHLTS